MSFKIGDRVRVCDPDTVIHLTNGIETEVKNPSCKDHRHFDTWIIDTNSVNLMALAAGKINHLWIIMTPWKFDEEKGNPNHSECSWYDDGFKKLEGPGWEKDSKFKRGEEVPFILRGGLEQHGFRNGIKIMGRLDWPHIEPGDWYVSFEVPDGWRFSRVVEEKDFRKK